MAMNMSDERAANLLSALLVRARESDWTSHAEDEALAYARTVLRRRANERRFQAKHPWGEDEPHSIGRNVRG